MSENGKPAGAVSAPDQGVFLAGELFALPYPSKPYQKRDGSHVEPVTVAVAVGATLIRVEFETEAACAAAIKNAMKGDAVMLPVWVNGPWDVASGRSAPVSYRGR